VWREADAARIDHVSHLVSAASEAASAALLAVDDLRRVMASRRAVRRARSGTTGEPGHEQAAQPPGQDDLVAVEALAVTADVRRPFKHCCAAISP
jgi:hypothetical protein